MVTHPVMPNQAFLLQGQVDVRLWNGVRNSTSEEVEQIGYVGPKSKIRDVHSLRKGRESQMQKASSPGTVSRA